MEWFIYLIILGVALAIGIPIAVATRKARNSFEHRASKVKIGMTLSEVQDIMGEAPDFRDSQKCKWEEHAGTGIFNNRSLFHRNEVLYITVFFANGKVSALDTNFSIRVVKGELTPRSELTPQAFAVCSNCGFQVFASDDKCTNCNKEQQENLETTKTHSLLNLEKKQEPVEIVEQCKQEGIIEDIIEAAKAEGIEKEEQQEQQEQKPPKSCRHCGFLPTQFETVCSNCGLRD